MIAKPSAWSSHAGDVNAPGPSSRNGSAAIMPAMVLPMAALPLSARFAASSSCMRTSCSDGRARAGRDFCGAADRERSPLLL